MEYKRLGRSGLQLSRLGLGSFLTIAHKTGLPAARQMIACALDAGINFFDTAENYANGDAQIMLGRVLREIGAPRSAYCLSSKVFWGGDRPTQRGLSRKHVTDACNDALSRLEVTYLDLYFCHRPDPDTPILETARAMHDLIVQGKVLYWGTSEWAPAQIRAAFKAAAEHGLHPPVAEQPPYSLFDRHRLEYQTQPVARQLGLGILSTTPLSSGILSGKYLELDQQHARLNVADNAWLRERLAWCFEEKGTNKVREVQRLASKLGATAAQVSIAWCLMNPAVTAVITGASDIEQLKSNLKAVDLLSGLDAPGRAELRRLAVGNRLMRAVDWLKYKSGPARRSMRSWSGR